MPAFSAASAMAPRSAMLPGRALSCGSVATISRAAATAKVSETGFALTFQIDSSACESASSPLCSVTDAGSDSISSGSSNATAGQVCSRCSEYFFCAPRSQMVAHGVTSLPVPAVVGTAISVFARAGTKPLPAARAATSSSKRPLAVPTISAFAVSIALPPPSATITSTPSALRQKSSYRAFRSATSGLGRTSSITQASWSFSSCSTRATRPSARASGKVTSAARRPASSFGRDDRAPAPYTLRTGLKYSADMETSIGMDRCGDRRGSAPGRTRRSCEDVELGRRRAAAG